MLSFDIENLIFGNGLDAKLGLTLFYRMKNGLCPDYLASRLSATVGSASTYPLRNSLDLQTLHTNSRLYYTSFLPSAVRDWNDLISKFQVGLKSLLRQGLSEPDFYGDLVYKLKKIVGSNNFSAQFIKIISHYKKIGYNINVLQQTACLVVNPIKVGNFAFLFNCTPVGRTSDSMMVPT